ncbi:MAG: T9SS type A sorting domain-containing protein, partial [Chitinophagaceae bacterium]|nr:T9SS type A sorting domain-containing protein [Chitinophagaceae bacterium]
IFDLNFNRLNTSETSISESFIMANRRGSVAFISNSDLGAINYQNLLSSEWYKAMAEDLYGKTIGEIQLQALSKAYDRTGSSDFINRCNIEQSILHADPALKLFTANLPDYATEATAIETNPAKIYTESDTMALNVKFFNLGSYASNDSVLLQLHREMPDGSKFELYRNKILAGPIRDSISFSFGIKGLFEEGTNYVIATIDGNTQYSEQDEDNNIAVLPMVIERRFVQPVFPYNYSITNQAVPVLKASTTNPTEPEKSYTFQIDTTVLFTSPTLQQWQVVSAGGILETTPPNPLSTDRVYYWRVFPTAPVPPSTATIFSFQVEAGSSKTGFNQSHFFQKQSITGTMNLNNARDYEFANKENTLFVSHGIFPISGTEDSHFSVTHNGVMKMASACLGRSIIFHVFDSLSFEPWLNVPARFGSANSCAPLRVYNYEFRYAPLSARKTIMDFLDSVPDGNFVAARLVLDAPYDSALVRFWQNDTTTFGSGISLYHKLKNLGFRDIDSMNRPRTFFFFFKKGDTTSYSPYTQFSDGLFDRLNAGIFPKTPDTLGKMTSPWMGPANQWDEALWQFTKHESDSALGNLVLKLWGRHKSGRRDLLYTAYSADSTIDISGIDATEYPYMQYEMSASGGYGSMPAQLNFWRLYYEPFADGALSAADSFYFYNDTLKPGLDTLRVALAFKNISNNLLAATNARIFLLSSSGNQIPLGTQVLRQLSPGDTAMIWLERELALPAGTYSLRIAVNEAGSPAEENYFNNLAVVQFEVFDKPLPVKLLLFNALKKEQDALLTWEAKETGDLLYFMVEHSTNGANFKEIGKVSAALPNQQSFTFTHRQPGMGLHQYRLKMVEKNQQIAYSDIKKVNFDWSDKLKLVPNPFNQYFTVVPANPLKTWQLAVRDAAGKLILMQKGTGQQKIDMSKFASGVYFAEWISENYRTSHTIVKQ